MKYIKFIFAGLLVFTLVFSSCSKDWLDTTPTESTSEKVVNETLDNLYSAINGLHRKMVSQDRSNQGMGGEPGFIICREAHGDDMTWKSQTWHQTHHTWAINISETSAYNSNVWRTYYEFINNANKILEKLDTYFPDSPEDMAKWVRGEALAIRGWCYFQLVQYYAQRYQNGVNNTQLGVPLKKKTSSELEQLGRSTVEEVYTFINEENLEKAAVLLQGYSPNDINHYSEKSVYGLLARVALTQQRYDDAADYAAKAIEIAEAEGHRIMTADQLDCGFAEITRDTKDAIYAALTKDDQTVYFYSFYAYMSWNFNSSAVRTGVKCISQSTYDMMSPTDLRRAWWDPSGTAAVPTNSWNKDVYQNRKFRAKSTADAVGDYPFMRLTEMYLIAAEAYARAGDTPTAKQYFNTFVAERDPNYVDLGNTGDAFAEEIMTHRRIELWGEGFRWFDLKRLNLPVNRTGSNFNTSFCGFLTKATTDDGWAYEIPRTETLYNENMVKNY